MFDVLGKLFPSRNNRILKSYQPIVAQINTLEDSISALSDGDLQGKRDEFKNRFEQGESLDQLLPEVFAVVREAAQRVLNMRHFDVQLMGGIALHQGHIAEMSTGEGKTLVATLPAYLNALSGQAVHIITVNDYLAKRDAEWMGKIYEFLGMRVGIIVAGQAPEERAANYANDIIYGTNNEFGFDYLRDNLTFSEDRVLQSNHSYAIIDEVDSVLIDEARTPLIISGPTEEGVEVYQQISQLVRPLKAEQSEGDGGDYSIDEKARQVIITESGHQNIESLLIKAGLLDPGNNLYDISNISLFQHVTSALRAHALFKKDVDYIVRNGKVLIVDEFTGRVMQGRRWSDGLHQAVEAKENVAIEAENQTLASITFQNYFRLYKKLSGMTGTADTEAYELQDIYNLEVVVLPTHKPMIRMDYPDSVYLTQKEKFVAIADDIKEKIARGQPVLAGTASIEMSELLSQALDKQNIAHQVLNAKQHEAESQIIAQAGRPGTVTIATNMAGRGTDIILGGCMDEAKFEEADDAEKESIKAQWSAQHDEVVNAGGLYIIGTERHESRRIDNQLRGRSGRQGDPGSSRFYLSLEDNLMRIFASDKIQSLMDKLGMEEGEAIEHPWVTRAIENAQRKVEAHNYDIRKNLLEYDDVINEQRHIVYEQRGELMKEEGTSGSMETLMPEVIEGIVASSAPSHPGDDWDLDYLDTTLEKEFGFTTSALERFDKEGELTQASLQEDLFKKLQALYQDKRQQLGEEQMQTIEQICMLHILDRNWKEHLLNIDHLRQGIGLRGYAQKNPKQEYKREAFLMFETMLNKIRYEFVVQILNFRAEQVLQEAESEQPDPAPTDLGYQHEQPADILHPEALPEDESSAKPTPLRREHPKIGRNDKCFCGSNKKYKHCCGKNVA